MKWLKPVQVEMKIIVSTNRNEIKKIKVGQDEINSGLTEKIQSR